MIDRKLLTIEQVACEIGVSAKTINNWYWFKQRNPDIQNEYIDLLPDFIQAGERQTRYWRRTDLDKLREFKDSIPRGRNGFMGSVTQKYLRKKEHE